MAKSTKIVVRFNADLHEFANKGMLEAKIRKALRQTTPKDASANGHRVKLPGIKTPVSLQWAIWNLFGVPAQMEAKSSGLTRGAYHPSQAMAALNKLNGFGVKVETDIPNDRYKKFWTALAAKEAKKLAKAPKAKAKKIVKVTARKAAAKKAAAKKVDVK